MFNFFLRQLYASLTFCNCLNSKNSTSIVCVCVCFTPQYTFLNSWMVYRWVVFHSAWQIWPEVHLRSCMLHNQCPVCLSFLRKEKKKNRNTNPAIGSHTHGWSVKHKMVRLSFPDTDVALNLRTRPLVVLMFRYTLEAGCWSQFRPNAHVSRENEAWHTKVTHPL